jgi:hypothetical protein
MPVNDSYLSSLFHHGDFREMVTEAFHRCRESAPRHSPGYYRNRAYSILDGRPCLDRLVTLEDDEDSGTTTSDGTSNSTLNGTSHGASNRRGPSALAELGMIARKSVIRELANALDDAIDQGATLHEVIEVIRLVRLGYPPARETA